MEEERVRGRCRARARIAPSVAAQEACVPRARGMGQHTKPSVPPEAGETANFQLPDIKFLSLDECRAKKDQKLHSSTALKRKEVEIPIRTKPATIFGKKGTSGKTVRVTSNYFRLLKTTNWSLYQYHIEFNPEEQRTFVRKRLLRVHNEVLGEAYMFDGSILFTMNRLEQDHLELISLRDFDKAEVRLTINFTKQLLLGDYQYIQLFNIILRHCLESLQFKLVGRDYFDSKHKISLRNFNLEVWQGYNTSILQQENEIMMCINTTHRVLRTDTVLDFIEECRTRHGQDWEKYFLESILGAIVFTYYNNKPYRVDDVAFDIDPTNTFKKGGAEMSYINYYKEKYQIQILNVKQPLLVSRPKTRDIRGGRNENIVLVPELCHMTGLTDEMRNDFNLMKAVASKTLLSPSERIRSYYGLTTRMLTSREVQSKLHKWNIKFSPKLEEISARRLGPETIIVGDEKKITYDNSSNWTQNFRNCSMLHSMKLLDWVVIVPKNSCRNHGKEVMDSFLFELQRMAKDIRFEMSQPTKVYLENYKISTYISGIEGILSKKNVQLVMCIINCNRPEIYSAIKKKCCVDRSVPSQVITTKILDHKKLPSVATKIAIQMNCKIRGTPWYVPVPFKEPFMIVGFDVCHDKKFKGKSWGALVASLDCFFSKFYSAVSKHSFGEELSNDIATHIVHAVFRFRSINNQLPSRIIIYRDGVGDSNIKFVFEHEVVMIKERLKTTFPQIEIPMAFLIVSKRIQSRVFVNAENPKPGTVVDDVITQPNKYDFFLVSQTVRQGTVTPTYYNVIYDTTKMKPDHMQQLAYKMTHLYYNCMSTMRVPAHVQYAHKLAFLVGKSILQVPSMELSDCLYFL